MLKYDNQVAFFEIMILSKFAEKISLIYLMNNQAIKLTVYAKIICSLKVQRLSKGWGRGAEIN